MQVTAELSNFQSEHLCLYIESSYVCMYIIKSKQTRMMYVAKYNEGEGMIFTIKIKEMKSSTLN